MLFEILFLYLFGLAITNPLPNPDYEGFNGIFDSPAQFCDQTMKEMFGVDVVENPGFPGFIQQNRLKAKFCEDAEEAVQCAAGTSEHFSLIGDECISQFYEDWRNITLQLTKKFGKNA
ncbi:unnamed protein product, partial [Mesorhabditis belari]|uniref:Uncharacterized protein n=1 Tax=Mesorhabditis belari TaxID=2138241 RepID=A0AAF3FDY8_9BILA